MMPPVISWADRPWVASTAWKACGHGWFLISAVTSPLMSLPRMMVRPLKAANPATTSAMLARSQVTVIRGSSARVTMAMLPDASSGFRVRPGRHRRHVRRRHLGRVGDFGGRGRARLDDQAWKPAPVPKRTRMASAGRGRPCRSGAVEIDHDPDDVGPELRVAEIQRPRPASRRRTAWRWCRSSLAPTTSSTSRSGELSRKSRTSTAPRTLTMTSALPAEGGQTDGGHLSAAGPFGPRRASRSRGSPRAAARGAAATSIRDTTRSWRLDLLLPQRESFLALEPEVLNREHCIRGHGSAPGAPVPPGHPPASCAACRW